MTPFELAEPRSLAEAIALLDPDDASVRPIAGGTALMLMMKSAVFRPNRLVSLRRIEPRYAAIEQAQGGTLRIGAMTTLAALESSEAVRKTAPLVTRTLRTLSNIRVRNVATVGGALAHADPHMDLPPVLIALGASIAVAGPAGTRVMAVEDLFAGYYETTLGRNELISALHLRPQGRKRAAYCKVTTGSADDWPALGVAVAIDTDGPTVQAATVVVSAATERAMRLKGAEAVLTGATIDDKVLGRAAEAAVAATEMLNDVRGSAPYKRELLRVYLARAVRQAMETGAPKR
jgi:carbon-monoxide dehydrogenase medium subunit